MAQPYFSASWYRVATLKPRLRSHVQIHRHHYRGQRWYVLQNLASQHYHRFSPTAYVLIGLMDGQRTVQEIWEQASARLENDPPTQDEVIHLLMELYTADVLQCDVPPDITALVQRHERQRRHTWQWQLLNPLFWRFPLCDPERLLQGCLPLARLLFSCTGALLWVVVVGMAAVLAGMHWHDLTHNLTDRVLTPQNVALLWCLFPLLKVLHEWGHGLATKVYGGEVHEMGVMLLALQPVPYVDASAASAFRCKRQRIVVGAAGMLVELFIASIAFFVWLNVEPGAVRAVAYNIILIAGVSTALFNANPLLRYDGYYIFADYLEMPNLRARSHAYCRYLCDRYLFGQREVTSHAATASERAWFVFYAMAACVYRLCVLTAITLFIAGKFFFIGVLIALVGVAAWLVLPVAKSVVYVCISPHLRQVRPRAFAVSVLIVAALLGIIGLVPMPLRTRATGVIWIPEQAYVRAGTDGFVERIVAQPGASVRQGEVLLICRDPLLATSVKVLEFRLQELQTRYMVQWLKEPGKAAILKEEIAHVEEQLTRVRERVAELVIRSRVDGTFVLPQAEDLLGRFVKQGTQLAYVLDPTTLTARVVVPQTQIDLVRQRSQGIEVRLAERLAEPLPATIWHEVPAATEHLPSMALGSQGGGSIAVDPFDSQGVRATQKLFQFDLALPSRVGIVPIGSRVYVRFDHGWEPLVQRWHRQLRQLFLATFYV
jgi:putative peptide zinc metalloprotease protein